MKTLLLFFLFFGIMALAVPFINALAIVESPYGSQPVTCPTGQVWNGTACTSPGPCPSGQIQTGFGCAPLNNPNTGGNSCPSGQVWTVVGTVPDLGTPIYGCASSGQTTTPPPTLPNTGGQQQQTSPQTQTTNVSVEIPNPLATNDITSLIDTIATWLLGIGSTIAVIIVLWAAFLFMTSGGNKERVTRARQTLWYAIIGLTVLLLAKGTTLLIQNILSGRF